MTGEACFPLSVLSDMVREAYAMGYKDGSADKKDGE